jgi:glycosidase
MPKLKALALLLAASLVTGCAAAGPEKGSQEFLQQAVIYEVNLRQFGDGGFKEVTNHLPRLSELGVDILWLMPIHPISELNRKGELGSPYSVANYLELNPDHGTEADFRELIKQAHAKNMLVILDWVANHTGWDNPWITEHPDWYTKDLDGNITFPPGTDWTDVADLDYQNQEMQEAMISAMEYWVTEFDVDGFRADVAHSVPVEFWNKASERLHQIKDVFMLAEDGGDMELLETAFDTNYAWSLQGLFNGFGTPYLTASDFRWAMQSQAEQYVNGKYQMIFIDNHDENSWQATVFTRFGDNVKNLALLSFTIPGMPLIYSGNEIGLDRQLLFFEKDPIVFPDQADWGKSEWEIFYKQLVDLKTQNPALWTAGAGGELKVLHEEDTFFLAFARSYQGNDVVVLINLSPEEQTQALELGDYAGEYQEFFSKQKMTLEPTMTLPANSFLVLTRNQ